MKKTFFVLLLILKSLDLLAGGMIEVSSNDWLAYDRVKFTLSIPNDENTGKRKRNIKPGLKDILHGDNSWQFYPSTGFIRNREWVFNRDSVVNIHKGHMQLIVKKPLLDELAIDTLTLYIPSPEEYELSIFPDSYYMGIFNEFHIGFQKTWLRLTFKDLTDSSCFLSRLKVKSNLSLQYRRTFYGYDYVLSGNEYRKEVWIAFYDSVRKKEYMKTRLWDAYSRYVGLSFAGSDGQNGKDGSNGKRYHYKNESELIRSEKKMRAEGMTYELDAGNGSNGTDGTDAKDVDITIKRAAASDSIALVIIKTADTIITCYIDFFNRGTLRILANGGSGGNAGHAGMCGIVYKKDIDSILRFGNAARAGSAGNGGRGGKVTLSIDTLYRPVMQNIKIDTSGGKAGFGGYQAEKCYIWNPYLPAASRGFFMFDVNKGFGFQKGSASSKDRAYKDPDLGPHGRFGEDGRLIIRYTK